MRLRDPQQWSLIEQQLKSDPGVGTAFHTCLKMWILVADNLMDAHAEKFPEKPPMEPVEAVRHALIHTEAELGHIDIDYFGQLLYMISVVWAHGEEMVRGMTHLELLPYLDAVRKKQAELQQRAEDEATANEESSTKN